MATSVFPLSRLRHEFGEHVIDKDSGTHMFHVSSTHSLIQAAGYLKHTRAQEDKKGVFFVGKPAYIRV